MSSELNLDIRSLLEVYKKKKEEIKNDLEMKLQKKDKHYFHSTIIILFTKLLH